MSSGKLPLTVILAVKNEAVNLPRCLAALGPAARVEVIDSQSVDGSCEIVRKAGAHITQFEYLGGYPKKRQWALDKLDLQTPWVLLLDADEVVPDELWQEIEGVIKSGSTIDAYLITKAFHFMGRRFRFGGFSHAAVLLFRQGRARFEHALDEPADALDMEVHERLIVDGSVGSLHTPLLHHDYKGLEAYIARHNHYSTWEARVRYQYLETGRWGKSPIAADAFGNAQERRRFLKGIAIRLPFEPALWFIYHYIVRLGFLEGRPGYIASVIRAQYIRQVRFKLWEMKKR